MSPRVSRLAIRGLEIEYEQAGSGPRAFVLVHGFTGSRDDWREQLPRLGALGHTIALDQRGHGGSTNTGDAASYTLDELTDDLAAVLDALDVGPIDLLGHSMGGMVALRLALASPERLASLVLMDTAASPIRMFPGEMADRLAEVVRSVGMAGMYEGMRQQALADASRAAKAQARSEPQASEVKGRSVSAAMRRVESEMGSDKYWARMRAKLLAMDPEAFAALGPALGEQAGVVERLGEIACPTLVLVGADDAPFLEPSAQLRDGIPDARLVTIPDAAHSPQLENPTAWLAAVTEHLERVR